MSEKKHIDRLFQEKFKYFEVSPEDKVWDNIEAKLKEKKKNRFTYKIKELIYSKIEKLVSENFINESEIENIVNQAVDDGKFKIYGTIHNKFEDVDFEIKKK